MARPAPPALSAPDLIGPVSILNVPVAGHRSDRGHRQRMYTHVRLEVDLRPESITPAVSSILERFERALREREVEETTDLLRLAAPVLHALGAVGFVRLYHWEIDPGGWLALPNERTSPRGNPTGALLRALDSASWRALASARTFAARLGTRGNLYADLVIRRLHRERRHALSIDLRGVFPEAKVRAVVGALRERLAPSKTSVTRVAYADA